ncbi:hypothetical protein Asp14428_21270 [Actinoplanes sp. NBRC 14428]|nr:hypothetical protein Asp14428_21270 [Actinoplanes sp. NBRC 14428]
MEITTLTGDDLGAGFRPGNAEAVAAVGQVAAGLDDALPVLLTPVRLETRFDRVQVAWTDPVSATATLTGGLAALSGPLERLAGLDLRTVLPAGTRARAEYKRDTEDPLVERAAGLLAAAGAALSAARPAPADVATGTVPELEELRATAARLGPALAGARAALAGLRSGFHRDRLTAELDRIDATAAAVLEDSATVLAPTPDRLLRERLEQIRDAAVALDPPGVDEPRRLELFAARAGALRALTERTLAELREPAALSPRERAGLAGLAAEASAAVLGATGPLLRADGPAAEDARALDAAIRLLGDRATAVRVRPEGVLRPPRPARQTRTVDVLRVRIFPDDVAVLTHETGLTAAEQTAGHTYWAAGAAGGGDEPAFRAAWRALVAKHGPRRAAWVARQTRPADPAPAPELETALVAMRTLQRRIDEVAGRGGRRAGSLETAARAALDAVRALPGAPEPAVARLREQATSAALRAAGLRAEVSADLDELTAHLDAVAAIPVPPPPEPAGAKDAAWTEPPRAGLLPRRFVVVTVSGDRVSHVVAGAEVAPELLLGLDPRAGDPADAPHVDPDGRLVVGPALRWMVDYAAAESAGMAVTVPITAQEATAGFDRVYVIGLSDPDPAGAAGRLRDALDDHHYTTGLALLPVDSPTNVTEAADSAFTSAADPDVSFDVEQGPALTTADAAGRPGDGRRLARALGLDAGVFAHVAHAGGNDVNEALDVNAALWPGTAGYAAEELLGGFLGVPAQDELRAFGTRHVLARGPLPSLRVGRQPYGVLVTSAFSRWTPDGGPVLPAGPALSDAQRAQRFRMLLRDVLAVMRRDWARHRAAVRHAGEAGITDPQQHIIELLGLESTSVGFDQRFSLNVGRRGAGIGPSSLHVGLPGPVPRRDDNAGAFALLDRFADVFRAAGGLPAGPLLDKGLVGAAFTGTYERLTGSRGYEVRYVDTAVTLTPDGEAGPGDIDALLAAGLETLARAAGSATPQPLLLLLLRQALLAQARDVALRIAVREGLATPELRARVGAGDLFRLSTLGGDVRVTRWSFLLARLGRLDGLLGRPYAAGPGTLYGYLTANGADRLHLYLNRRGDNPLFQGFPRSGEHADLLAPARRHAEAVGRLAAIPPVRLDQLLREHLDLCSHRLDAWVLGQAGERLEAMRDAAATGVHLGAFGWVEALTPNPAGSPETDVPAALRAFDPSPVFHDRHSQGFVHAPSVTHAVTAAVLRAGYVAQGDQQGRGRMAVNLSSRRVRTALALIDGVAAGNDLGSLLGYQLERDLHEAVQADGVALDDLIAPLRRAFPSAVPVDPASPATGDADRLVVDGLRVITVVRDWVRLSGGGAGRLLDDLVADNFARFPYGLTAPDRTALLPGRGEPDRLRAAAEAIDRLADTVDAVGDLVLAEGIHQIVQGNQVRAAAVLSALGEGRAPARPEIVDTPDEGTRVTHRVLLHLPVRDAAPEGWEHAPMTPRALAEPSLNHWLGGLLGPAGATRVAITGPDGVRVADVSLRALGVQPIDLLAALHDGFDQGLAELTARLVDTRRPVDVLDAVPAPVLGVSLDRDASWPDGVRGLPETAALLETAAALATTWRPAEVADYLLTETAAGATGGGPDTAEFDARATAAAGGLAALAARLAGLISDGATADPGADPARFLEEHHDTYRGGAPPGAPMARLDAWWQRRADAREAVWAAAGHGVAVAPPIRWTGRDQVGRELLDAVENAFAEVSRRLVAAAAAGDAAERLRAVFGSSVIALPHLRLGNETEIAAGLADGPARADRSGVSRWLAGAAAVREPVQSLTTLFAIGEAFGGAATGSAVVQLPTVPGETWAGATWTADGEPGSGAAGTAPDGDRVSLVLLRPGDRPTGSHAAVAVRVDTWSELVPAARATTALAVHYDQPDARAPQSLLLAVPPARRGSWRLEDLVQTLHDTLELAKDRAVEPEHLREDVYGQLLPALIGEIGPREGSTGLVEHRVALDFGLMQKGGTT